MSSVLMVVLPFVVVFGLIALALMGVSIHLCCKVRPNVIVLSISS